MIPAAHLRDAPSAAPVASTTAAAAISPAGRPVLRKPFDRATLGEMLSATWSC